MSGTGQEPGLGAPEPHDGKPPPNFLTCSMGWRRARGASGEHPAMKGSGCFRLLGGQPGGSRHGQEQSTPAAGVPTKPRVSGCLSPLLPSHASLKHSRKETFPGSFFFPFLPNFGGGHASGDVTAFLGEGHVAPSTLPLVGPPPARPPARASFQGFLPGKARLGGWEGCAVSRLQSPLQGPGVPRHPLPWLTPPQTVFPPSPPSPPHPTPASGAASD